MYRSHRAIDAAVRIQQAPIDLSGVVIGLFAPPLLLASTYGAGGRDIAHLTKRHDVKEMGADLETYLAPGATAIVAILDEDALSVVDTLLTSASASMGRPIDQHDYGEIVRAVAEARSSGVALSGLDT